jgi:hypothetical protein
MIAAARSALGVVAERFEGPALASDRTAIEAAAADLGRVQGRKSLSVADFSAWDGRLTALEAWLSPHEANSLFNPRRLAARLKETGA